MFIRKEELDRRREESNNLVARMSVTVPPGTSSPPLDTSRFRNDGTIRDTPLYSMEQKALIGAVTLAAGAEVASEVTGCSESYAAVIARGQSITVADPEERARKNQELKDGIYEALGQIRDVAREKLIRVLAEINEETLDAIKLGDKAKLASQIANQLSSVIDRTINKGETLFDQRQSHLHLYAPETRPLESFTIKTINPTAKPDATSSGQ